MVKVTYYLEVVSSWCHWVEPVWQELKHLYEGRVEFDWKIAQMPEEAYPVSREQLEWFYRRSGSMVGAPYMLNSGWFEEETRQMLAPNAVAEAARGLGVTDDRVRLALANAAVLEGRKIGRWDVAATIAARAGKLNKAKLLARAKSKDIAARIQKSSDEFDALQVNQRPSFLMESSIGDRAIFSGVVRLEPLSAAIDALLADEAAYISWKAHFGDPPSG